MVYTPGSRNGWRNIGKFYLKFDNLNNKPAGIFVNGALHWMHKKAEMILVFDLANETFVEHLAAPPLPTDGSLDFGVVGGVLFCAHRYFCSVTKQFSCYNIWLYKKKIDNYNMKEHQSLGWSLEFTAACHRPLAFTKSGDVLGYSSSLLEVYDPKTLTSKVLVEFKQLFCQVFAHKRSFVSLKDLGEESTKIVQSV
ncbi:uncharacterized protein LOC113328126 [Papaver somniferum]|uniref:uncharacterized protein LOC113328120 n=1 Tax=Papaver somniferum TaxID=3469 RepID=UPI000E6FE964|nr:uncharacterized protein LOC113328120 [Papaver somniferum]XP_026431002.1 uncharacterized protein LOC113328126 [Papaver somniferum]